MASVPKTHTKISLAFPLSITVFVPVALLRKNDEMRSKIFR